MKKSSKTFVISDETVNMYGFSTATDGIDLTDFEANPVMLYNHDYTRVIGQWDDVRKEGGKLLGVPSFDENDAEAMKYYDKVEQGILRGVSPGLRPIAFNAAKDQLLKSSVKEASITPVPGNTKALAIYDDKGKKLSAAEAKEFLLSFQPDTLKKETPIKMNEKFLAALIVLSAQAGLTINLSASSSEEVVLDTVKKIGQTLAEQKDQVTNLSGEVRTLKATSEAALETEISALITEAVNNKALAADQVPAFRELAKVNLSAFKTTLATLKPVKAIATGAAAAQQAAAVTGDKATWTYDEFALKAPKELEAMQVSDPAKFELLLSAKTKSAREQFAITI